MASGTRILCAISFGLLGALQLLLLFYFHPRSTELSRGNCYGKCGFYCLGLMRVFPANDLFNIPANMSKGKLEKLF